MADILVVGNMVADLLAKPVEEMPPRGAVQPVPHLELQSGGCGANTANALARLGIDVAAVGMVGKDPLGDFLAEDMRSRGVDVSAVVRTDKALTATTFVAIHADGERSFFHHYGASAHFTLEDIEERLLDGVKIVHIGGFFSMPALDGPPTAELLRAAKTKGAITCLDTAYDSRGRWMEALAPCLDYLDYFVPSLQEARALTGMRTEREIAEFFLKYPLRAMVIKLGQGGCYLLSGGQEWRIPAFHVQCVDATGAGDAFAAGFLAGILNGATPQQAGRLGNAVGALAVTKVGATAGVLDMQATLDFMSRKETCGAT